MVRIVAQYSDKMYLIVGSLPLEKCPFLLDADGQTFYRADTHERYVLYRPAAVETK